MTRKQEVALYAHWDREREMFHLKPWEMPPCLAKSPRRDGSGWAGTYALARERRLQLLAADPHHYDDIGG